MKNPMSDWSTAWQEATRLLQEGRYVQAEAAWRGLLGRLDQFPDNDETRLGQASVEANLASALALMGKYADAELSHARAQTLIQGLPDSEIMRPLRASARMNRAVNLAALGRHVEAEHRYAEAQTLLDKLPPTDAILRSRGRTRLNRACNLDSLGRHADAEVWHAEGQAILDALPASDTALDDRARARTNRANCLQKLGRYAEAERWQTEALDLAESLPGSGPVWQLRARLHMNRSIQLQAQGRYVEADAGYVEGQEILDALPDSEAVQMDRAAARMNRASNLDAMGRNAEAEQWHDEAQSLFDRLTFSEAVQVSRASVRLNRANCLRDQGRHEEAEACYAEAQALADHFPPSAASRVHEASIRADRASNLNSLGVHARAEQLQLEAQARFDALSDSDGVLRQRAGLRINRLRTLRLLHRHAESAVPFEEALALSSILQAQPAASIPQGLRLLTRHAVSLAAHGIYSAQRCAEVLLQLTGWAMTWLDVAVDPVSDPAHGPPPGAREVSATIELALSWLIREHPAQALDLLVDHYSRFAASQRLLAIEASGQTTGASGSDADSIRKLKLQLRSLAGQMQGLQSRDPSARDAEFEDQLQAASDQRAQVLDALQRGLRQFRSTHDVAVAALDLVHVRAVLGDGRALVVLMQVRQLRPDGEESEPRALAVVITTNHSHPQVISLPHAALELAIETETSARRACLRDRDEMDEVQPIPHGRTLRAASSGAWAAIEPSLTGIREVHIAAHHALAHLPWNGVEDECATPRRLCVHHGTSAAVRCLERGPQRPIAPPEPDRPLGLLAYSPAPTANGLQPIPGVFVDRAVTQALVADHVVLGGRAALLQASTPLLQLSCHGHPRLAHTGPGDVVTSAYDMLDALRRRGRQLEACVLVSCSTGQAGQNAWGEAGGWAALLGERTQKVVGALYPVDDFFCTLYVQLLHRSWQRLGDLTAAADDVRRRLRNGCWGDTDDDVQSVSARWLDALGALPVGDRDNARARVAGLMQKRHDAYELLPELGLMAESFVVFG